MYPPDSQQDQLLREAWPETLAKRDTPPTLVSANQAVKLASLVGVEKRLVMQGRGRRCQHSRRTPPLENANNFHKDYTRSRGKRELPAFTALPTRRRFAEKRVSLSHSILTSQEKEASKAPSMALPRRRCLCNAQPVARVEKRRQVVLPLQYLCCCIHLIEVFCVW